MNTQNKIWFLAVWITLVLLCALINRNTNAVNIGNDLNQKQEYERVLLGCNTSGAIESKDPELRHLCDDTLVKIERDYFKKN